MAASWSSLGPVSVAGAQAPTETPPVPSTDGMGLAGVAAVTFWLEAAPGETIAADVGQIDVYQYDNGKWGLAPGCVLPIPPTSAGLQRVQVGTVSIDNSRGRLAGIANGISVTGGNVIVELLATTHSPSGPRRA